MFLKVGKEHEMSSPLLEIEGQLNQFSRQSVVAVMGHNTKDINPLSRLGLG